MTSPCWGQDLSCTNTGEFLWSINPTLPIRRRAKSSGRVGLRCSHPPPASAWLFSLPVPTAICPSTFRRWTSSAHAAETAQNAPGFADLVAKVKPAVISVRVKIDSDAENGGMVQNERMNSDQSDNRRSISFQSSSVSASRTACRSARGDYRRRLRLLHFARRLCRDQQSRGRPCASRSRSRPMTARSTPPR